MIGAWEQVDHVQAIGNAFERGRGGSCPQWLHQMRSDLGRLGAIAEILQVGPFLALGRVRLASWVARWYVAGKMQGAFYESFPHGGCYRVAGRAGLRASPQHQFDPGACLQNPGGKGAVCGPAKGLQGIAEENTGRQDLFRSVGQCARCGRAKDLSSREAADQNWQHRKLIRNCLDWIRLPPRAACAPDFLAMQTSLLPAADLPD